jgi:hypothetical protein
MCDDHRATAGGLPKENVSVLALPASSRSLVGNAVLVGGRIEERRQLALALRDRPPRVPWVGTEEVQLSAK